MKKIIILLVIVVSAVAIFVGYQYLGKSKENASVLTETALSKIKARGKLIVGSDIPYGVMEFWDESGNPIGFDVDVAKKIADNLGVKLEFKDYEFDNLFTLVKNGEIDLVLSSITITEERQKEMLFSIPYFSGGQAMVTKFENKDIKSINDISNKKVGVQEGTTGNDLALKYTVAKSVFPFKDSKEMIDAINKNKIDLFIVDYIEAIGIQKQDRSLKIAGDPLTQEFYGVVTKLGNDSLMAEINNTIKEIKRNGEFDQLKDKWLK